MNFRTTISISAALLIFAAQSFAQNAPAPANPAPATTPAAAPLPAPAPASKEPDYPMPRSFVLGISYSKPFSSDGPDLKGGTAATSPHETLNDLGKYRDSPAVYASIPISRTGILAFEFERLNGDSTQTLTADAFLNSNPYTKGEVVASSYRVLTGRLYLEDLFYPHRFPVAHLRFKSIWGVRYVGVNSTVDVPATDAADQIPGETAAMSTRRLIYPELGMAMEYQPEKHLLFRVEGAGFAIPHRSTFGEARAFLSVRQRHLEVIGGVKTIHFKTSPQKDEYAVGTTTEPYVELRWHW